MQFLEHPLFLSLLSLDLPRADFAIAGSGPLFARGWIDSIGDLDVIARGPAWDQARKLGKVADAPLSTVQRVSLLDDRVEVLDGWFPEIWSADLLIDGADMLLGLRFVKLHIVAETKKMLNRPQDKLHLAVLAAHGIE